uniref:Uncharacterized protein n=1 Tax=Arundo donax TaxID=35708 RepID=A0A0A9EGR6_ARUDO
MLMYATIACHPQPTATPDNTGWIPQSTMVPTSKGHRSATARETVSPPVKM